MRKPFTAARPPDLGAVIPKRTLTWWLAVLATAVCLIAFVAALAAVAAVIWDKGFFTYSPI